MAKSPPTSDTGTPAPFASLLAVSSLVLALLLVAGFSYRWTYYYNFGLKDLAFEAPLQSLAISALELIRNPSDALFSFLVVVIPLLALNGLLTLIASTAAGAGRLAVPARWVQRGCALDNRLVTDALIAVVLIYSAYWAGSQSGWEKFRVHVTEAAANPLPAVTAIVTAGSTETLPVACRAADWDKGDAKSDAQPSFIGSATTFAALRSGAACDTRDNRSWRLLYRNDKFIYLFASGSGVVRPLTIVLPNSDRFVLVMGAANEAAR